MGLINSYMYFIYSFIGPMGRCLHRISLIRAFKEPPTFIHKYQYQVDKTKFSLIYGFDDFTTITNLIPFI